MTDAPDTPPLTVAPQDLWDLIPGVTREDIEKWKAAPQPVPPNSLT